MAKMTYSKGAFFPAMKGKSQTVISPPTCELKPDVKKTLSTTKYGGTSKVSTMGYPKQGY